MIDSILSYFTPKIEEDCKMDKKSFSEHTEPMKMGPDQAWHPAPNSSQKTKKLEQMHRMEDAWFSPNVNYQQPSSQMVWDMTRNCYAELPVQQIVPFNPTYPPPYSCLPHLVHNQQEAVDHHNPTALPLADLFGGVIMDFMDNLATNTLIQYVCDRTRPSAHRLAAETLARSNLNPNAKEFTPTSPSQAPAPVLDLATKPSLEEEVEEDAAAKNADDMAFCDDNSECDMEESVDGDLEESEDKSGTENARESTVETAVSDDEDWWDSDEEPCTPSQDIDPSEFEVIHKAKQKHLQLEFNSESNQLSFPITHFRNIWP